MKLFLKKSHFDTPLLAAESFIFAALAVYLFMPKMMVVTKESRYNYQTTIQKLEEAIASLHGGHKGTLHMTEEIKAKTQKDLGGKIGVVQLCHADHAFQVLAQDKTRFVSCLMPCSISVWESQEGKTYVSKMNTGLMGKLFGGVISSVMGACSQGRKINTTRYCETLI